ncbi:hypothetical protein JCM19046_3412 [Bacillus sp. JCM 19046]|nr:hypothetical protein JCM19046_3412 [Bacillus sp. JCM 19046]
MKKTTTLMATMVAVPFILGACSDSDDDASSAPADDTTTPTETETEDSGDENAEDEPDESDAPAEEGEDQLDLVVGDTASWKATLLLLNSRLIVLRWLRRLMAKCRS